MANIWVEHARTLNCDLFIGFARLNEGLNISETDITGKMLIAGCGSACRERVYAYGDEWGSLRAGISDLTLIDPDFIGDPLLYFDVSDRIKYKPESLQTFLPEQPPDTFDTITLFGIPDMEEQLGNPGLTHQVYRTLKTGGTFIGSGSFTSLDSAKQLLKDNGFTPDPAIYLANIDFPTGQSYFPNHVGFIARKG